MKKLLVIMIVILPTQFANAQYSIAGKLVDKKTREPIESATLQIKSGLYVFTDSEGSFQINNNTKESLIQITSIGYKPKEILIKDSMPIIIELESASLSLKEVVVAADNSRPFTTLSKIDLNLRPSKSSQELLRYVPGLFIAQHQGGGKAEQIFLRGFDIDHGTDITMTVDGLPVNMVSHAHGQGYADLHFLIPELVKNINFGTGPYYANQGNFNTAGYVSFETLSKLEKNRVQLESGQFNTARALGMFQLVDKQKHSAYISSEYLYSDGPFESPQRFKRLNVMSRYNWQLNEYNKLQVIATNFQSLWNASGQIPQRAVDAGLISRFGAIDDTEGGSTTRTNLSVQLNTSKNHQKINTQFYYSRYTFDLFSNFTFFLNDPVHGDQIRQREKRDILGYIGSYQIKYYGNNISYTTVAGWGFRSDRTHNSELSHTFNKTKVLENKALGNIRELNSYIYINENISRGKFSINPAIRFDHFQFRYADQLNNSNPSQQKNLFSPKFSVYYNHHKNLQLFFKAGKGFHSNDTRVVTQNNGKQILPAAYGNDLGLVWKPSKNLLINAAAWHLYLEQEFVYVGDEAVVEESGRTRRLGLDLSARYQFNKIIMADINLNYAHARSLDHAKGENFIPLAPVFTSIGGISYMAKEGFNGSLRYRYLMDRPANKENSLSAKGYLVTDLTVNYTKPRYEIGLSVENLFNNVWNEAQFETTSRLRSETAERTEIHFTPGTPFFTKLRFAIFF